MGAVKEAIPMEKEAFIGTLILRAINDTIKDQTTTEATVGRTADAVGNLAQEMRCRRYLQQERTWWWSQSAFVHALVSEESRLECVGVSSRVSPQNE